MTMSRGARTVRIRRSVLPLALLTTLGVATPAAAVTEPAVVSVRGQSLQYTAAPGQANRLTVTMAPTGTDNVYRYTIDDVYPIRIAFGDCRHPVASDRTKVTCPLVLSDDSDPFYAGKFYLGDKNDTLRFVNPSDQDFAANQFWLGAGNDRAVTRQGDGGPDGSSIYGQNGQDVIDTGPGGDLSFILGGNNNDTISVHGLGNATGGNGDDKLYGFDDEQSFSGDAGDDLIDTGDGADLIYGGPGDDRLYGRKGDDRIYGNSGNDQLYGGLGQDFLSGGPGRDLVRKK